MLHMMTRKNNMRYVKQKHANSCAIASLSMITGIGYDRMLKIVFPKRKSGDHIRGTSLEDALRALDKMKVSFRFIFKKIDPRQLKHNAYISINVPAGNRHAIVWDASIKNIRDPHKSKHNGFDYIKKNMNFIIEILDY